MPGNEFTFLCGEAGRGRDPAPNAVCLDLEGSTGSVRLKVEDISARLVSDIPDVLIDLLEIAAYVYAADAAVSRGGEMDAQMGKRWRRRFRMTIPVRQPDTWKAASLKPRLERTLSFLSDDHYGFDFVAMQTQPPAQTYFAFGETAEEEPDVEWVQLFSGGLDSFAGAAERLANTTDRIALVSHRSASGRDPVQVRLVKALQEAFGADRVRHIPVSAHLVGGINKEPTHRSRSFLFAALGMVVAELYGTSELQFCENGVTSLQLPISPEVVGARATRSTHPKALKGFGAIFSALTERDFTVSNPLSMATKTEVIEKIVTAGMEAAIRDTRSCAHVRSATRQYPHCGACSQCIDRRLAIVAAGAEEYDPAEAYKVDLFVGDRREGPQRALALGMISFARRAHGADADTVFGYFPELSRVIGSTTMPAAAAGKNFHDLLLRHGEAVLVAMERGYEQHRRALAEGVLPESCLLRMAAAGTADPVKQAIPDPDLRSSRSPVVQVSIEPRGRVSVGNVSFSGQGAAVLRSLVEAFEEDQNARKNVEEYRVLPTKELAVAIDTARKRPGTAMPEDVRLCIHRIRQKLRKEFGPDIELDDMDVIENVKRTGYRLNPRTVRLVEPDSE